MPKTIFLLAATGQIGLLTLRALLARGHTVTAFVRTPAKIPSDLLSEYSSTLFVVTGSIDNLAELTAALKSRKHDAVISSLGPVDLRGHKAGTIAEGYRNIAKAMQETGVSRIWALSTFSYLVEGDGFSFGRNMVVGLVSLLIPAHKAEFTQIAKVFAEETTFSGLDWTVYRVGRLKDGEPGTVTVGSLGADKSSAGITRSGVAQWLVEQVEKDMQEWVGKLPYISSV